MNQADHYFAQDAKERLRMARASEINVIHNKSDGTACSGLFVISFVAWDKALESEDMERGGVSGVCQVCGTAGFVGQDQKLVDLSGQN